MKPLAPRRNGALLSLLTLSLLAGCGGGGGGSKALTPAEKSAKAFKNANVEGSFDTPDKAQSRAAAPPTVVTIQFADDNTSGTGVASFVTGSIADNNFAAYAADISNLEYTVTSNTASAVSGTVEFTLTNFTTNKYFAGTVTFKGNYTVGSSASDKITITSGTFTGKDPKGVATTATAASLGYQVGASNIDLSGTYNGKITVPLLGDQTITGATLVSPSSDKLHLSGTFPFTVSGSDPSSLVVSGAYTRSSLSGSFNPSTSIKIKGVTIPAGLTGQVYVKATDAKGTAFSGTYVVLNADGTVYKVFDTLPLTGTITGTKGAATGGGGGTTTTTLKTGYYDGGIKAANGALDGRIFKLNITKASSTVGNNGGMVIVTNNAAPNIGGRVASVTSSGSTVNVTIDQISNTYSKIVLSGPVSGTAFTASYTATKLDGTTETGTLDQFGTGSTTTASLTATWTGTATSTGPGGKTSSFAASFKSNGDGTVLVTPTSTVGGGTNPTVTIPAFTAFQAGSSFAGHVNGSVPVTSLGATFTVTVIGDFDGDTNGTRISGDYRYGVYLPGSTSATLSDAGTLSLTKS